MSFKLLKLHVARNLNFPGHYINPQKIYDTNMEPLSLNSNAYCEFEII